jgi:hypothetical protein
MAVMVVFMLAAVGVMVCSTVVLGALAAFIVGAVGARYGIETSRITWLPPCLGIIGMLGGLPTAVLAMRYMLRMGPVVRSIKALRGADQIETTEEKKTSLSDPDAEND